MRKKPTKVLVAEDDATTRQLIARMLEAEGASAIQCSDGKRCWQTLLDNPDIKLVVTDMYMPEMPGSELIAKMKSEESTREIPIIMVSGRVKLSEIDSILALGADRFLPKPIEGKDLKKYSKFLLARK
jgi:CheY-like chemotaxis protein